MMNCVIFAYSHRSPSYQNPTPSTLGTYRKIWQSAKICLFALSRYLYESVCAYDHNNHAFYVRAVPNSHHAGKPHHTAT
jgi:hypothetical protein